MKKSVELKQERASLMNAQQVLVNAAKAEQNRSLNADETVKFDDLQSQIEAKTAEIARAEKFESNQAAMAASAGEVIDAPAVHKSTKNERFSFVDALRSLATGKQLTGKAAEMNERAISEMKAQGMEVGEGLRFNIPSDMFAQRGQSVSDDSGAKGGALVASTPQYVSPLAPNVDVLSNLGVTVMDGLVGDVPLPTNGLFTFGFVGETASVSETDVAFAGPTLTAKRCSGVAGISNKLLRQTSFSVEQLLLKEINDAYGRAIIVAAINGPGTNSPTGLYSLITTNINTTAGLPTKAIITALESLIDAADGTNVSRGYLSDTKLANTMKNVLLDAGSGRFLFDGQDLNGYKYERSTLVPTLDTGASHPLIFGDWSQLKVGYWGNLSILIDPYTLASSGKVKMVIDGYADVACTNEKAFAINKVLIDA